MYCTVIRLSGALKTVEECGYSGVSGLKGSRVARRMKKQINVRSFSFLCSSRHHHCQDCSTSRWRLCGDQTRRKRKKYLLHFGLLCWSQAINSCVLVQSVMSCAFPACWPFLWVPLEPSSLHLSHPQFFVVSGKPLWLVMVLVLLVVSDQHLPSSGR